MAISMTWAAAAIMTASLVVAGGMSLSMVQGENALLRSLAAASQPPASERLLTQVGDDVLMHVSFYDNHGRLLLSTRAADRPAMEQVKATFPGLYALPFNPDDAPQRHTLDEGRRPLPLDAQAVVPLGQGLLGKPVGYVTAVPVVGEMQGYNQTTVLERTRGPFNLTLPLSTATLDKLTGGNDSFALDDLFEARVLERGEHVSRIRLDVHDGQVLPIRNAGFTATVRMDEPGERFFLRLDAEEGHEFALNENCQFARYVLPLGAYRVTAVDEEAITLSSSPTKWPQMIGQDLVMVFEILEIERPK